MSSFVIAQGGGPTAVINQTLCGAIVAARALDPALRILGARHGVRGLVSGDLVDLGALSTDQLLRLGNTPNSGLGSTRDKPDASRCDAILDALTRQDARAFIYIGGNDTAGTLELLRARSTTPCRFVHAPKTIDNDLVENDHVPGFISAATFVAQAFVSVDLDFRAMPGIYVGIVMGRHAGFLTAAPAGWRTGPDDAPHLIYTPERAFDLAGFLDDVDRVYSRLGRCVVAMSEGVQDEAGTAFAEALVTTGLAERDQHGNVQLTGGDLGLEIQRALKGRFPKARARVDTLGYLPRGFLGVIDPVDRMEAHAAGTLAAQQAFEESGSVVLTHDGQRTVPKLVALDRVAGRTRHMPPSFYADATTLSAEGQSYFRRLLPPRPDLYTPVRVIEGGVARDSGLEDLLAEDLDGVPALTTRAMFGGLIWLHDGHLLCGARQDGLLIRLGAGRDGWALALPGITPMLTRGRPMAGWVWAGHDAYGDDTLRRRLIDAALLFVRALPGKITPLTAVPWDFPEGPGPTPQRKPRARRLKV